MYRNFSTAVVIPAFNEELLIGKTIAGIPAFVDHLVVVNDASTDGTAAKLEELAQFESRLVVLEHRENLGVGGALMTGYRYVLAHTNATAIGIVAGDDQFDTAFLEPMLDRLIDGPHDYVKASRFFHREAFKMMPKHRRFGNIFISLLTKFSTGYYTITDITNGCGWLRRRTLEQVNFELVKNRYDHETSFLTALSIAGAKIADHAVPAKYGDETSTISLLPTAIRNLWAVSIGFWRRIYHKYVLYSFHPIALLLVAGLALVATGVGFSIFILAVKLAENLSPSTGTVMLAVVPFILGFQLLLTALVMDVSNEGR